MSTLLKWLFTIFAFWWLYHALRPWLLPPRPATPPPPKSDISENQSDKIGEYIDYEEVDED